MDQGGTEQEQRRFKVDSESIARKRVSFCLQAGCGYNIANITKYLLPISASSVLLSSSVGHNSHIASSTPDSSRELVIQVKPFKLVTATTSSVSSPSRTS